MHGKKLMQFKYFISQIGIPLLFGKNILSHLLRALSIRLSFFGKPKFAKKIFYMVVDTTQKHESKKLTSREKNQNWKL